jgi:hypothetical protein
MKENQANQVVNPNLELLAARVQAAEKREQNMISKVLEMENEIARLKEECKTEKERANGME